MLDEGFQDSRSHKYVVIGFGLVVALPGSIRWKALDIRDF